MFIPIIDDIDTWDTKDKILFIEDLYWMHQDADIIKDLNYEIMDIDYDELGISSKEIFDYTVFLADSVGEILNQYHKTTFSPLYWRRGLFRFLFEFVSLVALRYARLCIMIKKYPDEKFYANILDNSILEFKLLDPTDIHRCNLQYVMHIYSLLLQLEDFPIKTNVLKKNNNYSTKYREDCKCNEDRKDFYLLLNFIRKIVYRIKHPIIALEECYYWIMNNCFCKGNNADVEVMLAWFGSKKMANKLGYQTNGKVVSFSENIPVWIPRIRNIPVIDWNFRNRVQKNLLIKLEGVTGWKKAVARLVFEELPCCFIENYHRSSAVYRQVFEQYPKLKVILSSSGALFTESMFALSEQREKNVKFCFMGHGAAKLTRDYVNRYGYMLSDFFFGWGKWGEDISKDVWNYHRSPAEKLYGLYDDGMKKINGRGILYVGDYCHPVYQYIGYHTMGRIYDNEKRFIKAIGNNIRGDIVIRNYPYEYVKVIDNLIKKDFSNINISRDNDDVCQQTFAEALCSANIVVMDHIETPWLEALYIRKPFIAFFDDAFTEHYFDLESEKPYLDMMREVGLIQNGPETAAEYLNEIYENIDKWWNEPRRQEVVSILRERYTEPYVDAEEWWCNEVNNILKHLENGEEY